MFFNEEMKIINIGDIAQSILSSKVRISDHAYDEAENDHLSFEEIYYSVLHGEIIEVYPQDAPYPSCLILGQTFNGGLVHSVWAYNGRNQWAVVVTVYRPDPGIWIDGRKRRV